MSTLARFDSTAMDNVPRPCPGALVYVYTQPTTGIVAPSWDGTQFTQGSWSPAATPLATLFADPASVIPLPNPFPCDGSGSFFFYAVQELYTIVLTGSTLAAPVILPDQSVASAAAGVALKINGAPASSQVTQNLIQGAGVTITDGGSGNITFAVTGSGITFKTNGTTNSTQVLLNIANGSGISVAEAAGTVTITNTNIISFETNGTPNGDQALLNLKHGVNTTVVDDGIGGITIDSAYPIFQQNGSPLTSSGTVNYVQGTGIVITNPSAGNVNIAVAPSYAPTVFQVTATLSAAQILALNTVPITLVPAAGSGTIIVPMQVEYEFNEVGAAFAGVHTGDLAVYLLSSTVLVVGDSTGLLDQTVQTFESNYPTVSKTFGTNAQLVNVPLVLKNTGAAYTGGGTSTLDVTVTYAVVAVV